MNFVTSVWIVSLTAVFSLVMQRSSLDNEVESQFFEPPRENNLLVQEIRVKVKCSTEGREQLLV